MLQEIKVTDIDKNAFEILGKRWALVTAGDKDDFNTMTVSWGQMGVLWFEYVTSVYVRPTRYTYEYMEKNDYFTISFFTNEYNKDLQYLGTVSGRDEDKVAKTSLTPAFLDDTVGFEQAEYVIVCKKAHVTDITRDQFVDKKVESVYTDDNLHRAYTGVIKKVYKKV
ncbi:MAG: flavin reductase family protein [Clostridia bacterium]